MRVGIVTGASSGIGRAFAQKLDAQGGLDELWLIARREERLRQVAAGLGRKCRVLPLDLTARGSAGALEALLSQERPVVGALVCAAGFGKFGRAEALTAEETDEMIALNCRAAVEVTRVCTPYLGPGSRVLEVCSCAAFQPLPCMSVYAATKAFLLHYTRALRRELAPRRVKVTAVCPFWVRTEFEAVARDTREAYTVGHITRLAQRPEGVAAWALAMNRLGLAVATCSPAAFLMRVSGKLLPSGVTMTVWEGLRRI